MIHPVLIVQPPNLATRVFHIFKVAHAGVAGPQFATPPGTHVEDMVKDAVDYPAVADHQHGLPAVALDKLFDKKPNAFLVGSRKRSFSMSKEL